MTRPMLALLLLTSLAVVGLLGFMLIEGGGGDRQARDVPETERAPVTRIENASGSERPEDARSTFQAATWTVAGRVRDRADIGIPSARVVVYTEGKWKDVATDADGRFEVEIPHPAYSLDVFAKGYLPHIDRLTDRPSRILEQGAVRDIELRAAASLSGRVMDTAGNPVAKATVWVISPEHFMLDRAHGGNSVRSDENGDFVFHGLPAGTLDLGARAPGRLPAMVLDVAVPARGEVRRDVTLRKGRAVDVVVHGAGEATQVLVMDSGLRAEAHPPPGGFRSLADALVGRQYIHLPVFLMTGKKMRFTALPPRPCDFFASDPQRVPIAGKSSVLDNTDDEVALSLQRGRSLVLTVVDAVSRQPLEPRISWRRRTDELWGPARRGADGNVFVAAGDEITLRFELEGYETLDHAIAATDESLDVALQPKAGGETGTF
ncbi:MAG: carboxypeptidase-like regulatory domain-containing protein, partial [Planctomycetota bacterium]|nr:carboxypeptidase-like regulatory domain-containing protein [Planctomycetota bacterium]